MISGECFTREHIERPRETLGSGDLMAICDQLKASLKTAQETQLNLADSLVKNAIF